MKRHPHFLPTAVSLLLCLGVAAYGQSAPPAPKTILSEMVSRYASLSSYQDTGVVQTLPAESLLAAETMPPRLINVSSGGDTLVSFRTYFVRPRKFRFEWKSSLMRASKESVLWSDGKRHYSWTPAGYPGREGFELRGGGELWLYADDAVGMTAGAISFVPGLLVQELNHMPFGEMVLSMTELSLLRDEQVEGEACYVISGKMYETPWVLWVGKSSRLLRKTRTLYVSGSFHEMAEKGKFKTSVAEEVHRNIRVNEKIPGGLFRFRPQLGADDIDLTR